MAVIHLDKRDNPYVQIDKRSLEDDRLSWKAKGLLAYLLSKPNDWKVWVNELVKRSPDGEYSVRTALEELIKHKYAKRSQLRNPDGSWGQVEYVIYEIPHRDNWDADNSDADNSDADNRDHSNNDPSENDSNNNDDRGEENGPNIYRLYEENIGLLTPVIADDLKGLEADYSEMWLQDAVKIAVRNNARSLNYVKAILERWGSNGKDDGYKSRTKDGRNMTREEMLALLEEDDGK